MDIKKLSEIHGLTVEEFAGILDVFIDTARIDVEKIQAAIVQCDADAAEKAAHSVKGAAGNLGFEKMFEIARTLEIDAKNNELDRVNEALSFLIRELETIISQARSAV